MQGGSSRFEETGASSSRRSGLPQQAAEYKIREEREVRAADERAVAEILEALGLRPSFAMRNIARPIGCRVSPA